ncbi:hypothetical protein MBLNU459_g4203t2 [Dothideomycetes sp. NU459]
MSSAEVEGPPDLNTVPQVPITFIPATAGETFSLGPITIRIMEDGSNTDHRIGAAEFTVPANTAGPPAHWHEMHDETFLVTQGSLRFTWHPENGSEATKTVDAKAGDYVVEAKFFNTYTPSFYINYFRLLAKYIGDGKAMTPEANKKAMASFATIPIPKKG